MLVTFGWVCSAVAQVGVLAHWVFTIYQWSVGGIASRSTIAAGKKLAAAISFVLTVSANHELVDGAPFARFIRHLTELVESAECLHDATEQCRER